IPVSQVLNAAKIFSDAGVSRLSLADTTGMANPRAVKNILNILKSEIKDIPLGLHLHDTRGLGMVNLMAGMECGVIYFDTALGGMGGCPFVKGAAGNIATEDTVYLMESLGINTGIDIEKVAECSRQVSDFLGRRLPGKMYQQSCRSI
ncbi:hydroxymethylglutaryl-CoA lyase, partial [Desulfobacterales bacterium HSG17]|nr:hydroxymethylglutaryl-CoA lyase [Desulfobacterales bacterium HSG17]